MHTPNLGFLELHAVRQGRSRRRERALHACEYIGRAADHLDGLFLAGRHLAHAQLVRVGVLFDFEHLADDDTFEIASLRFDRVDFQTGHRQAMRQSLGIERGIDPLT